MNNERSATINADIETICNHLTERTATLFLGAGINAGLRNNSNDEFPLSLELSRLGSLVIFLKHQNGI